MRSNLLLAAVVTLFTAGFLGIDLLGLRTARPVPLSSTPSPELSSDRDYITPVTTAEPAEISLEDLPSDVDVASLRLLKDLADAWSGKPAESQPETSSLLEGQ